MVHEAGGLLYYDGANANAIMGITRPGDMGFDVASEPSKPFPRPMAEEVRVGPVGVAPHLVDFLPVPVIIKNKVIMNWIMTGRCQKVKSFYGNFVSWYVHTPI